MEEKEFWDIVEEIKDKTNKVQKLAFILSHYSVKEIVHFSRFFDDFAAKANNEDIWKALDRAGIWASDDGFHYFTAWLVSQGKEVYEDVMGRPEKVSDYTGFVDYAPGEESLFYTPRYVCERKIEMMKKGELTDESIRLLLIYNKELEFYDLDNYFK